MRRKKPGDMPGPVSGRRERASRSTPRGTISTLAREKRPAAEAFSNEPPARRCPPLGHGCHRARLLRATDSQRTASQRTLAAVQRSHRARGAKTPGVHFPPKTAQNGPATARGKKHGKKASGGLEDMDTRTVCVGRFGRARHRWPKSFAGCSGSHRAGRQGPKEVARPRTVVEPARNGHSGDTDEIGDQVFWSGCR